MACIQYFHFIKQESGERLNELLEEVVVVTTSNIPPFFFYFSLNYGSVKVLVKTKSKTTSTNSKERAIA